LAPSDDPADAAARLEAALERISQNAHRRPTSAAATETGTEEVAARLDVLIHQLRSALDGDA